MKFIRKNGRIIPIKEKNEKSPYLKSAAIGAATGAAGAGAYISERAATAAMNAGKVVPRKIFGAATIGLGLGTIIGSGYAIGRSIGRGIKEGRKDKSIVSGIGTAYTDNWVSGLGMAAGAGATFAAGLAGAKGFRKLQTIMRAKKMAKVLKVVK